LLSILNLELNLKFKIEFGLKPIGFSLAHSGRTKTLADLLGQSNRPRQSARLPLSPPNPSRLRRHPAISAISGNFRRRPLGQMMHPNGLFLLHQVDLADTTSPRRSFAIPGSGSAGSGRLQA
jgi:hypothetical protein